MALYIRLWIMMFLQYFTWGVWFVTLGSYITAHTGDVENPYFAAGFIGVAYATTGIAAMISPFFTGMIADRFFPTQIILGILHLAGAFILYFLNAMHTQSAFYLMLIIYFLCYMPTLALTNSLSFHHLQNPEKEFPLIRVLGTIGWIVAGLLVGVLTWKDKPVNGTAIPQLIAAGSSLLLGLYCFALPHTPASKIGEKIGVRDVLGLDALKLMKSFSFSVFVIGSFLVAIPLQFYYNYTESFLTNVGMENAAAKMTMGQMGEIVFLLMMPLFFRRLGVKYMLLIGMLAWTIRYVLFAYGNVGSNIWMLYAGILLHGICYDFFFVTGQIYVDNKADKSVRSSAQGFIAFATLGVGAFIGGNLSGLVDRMTTVDGAIVYANFWLIPAAGAGVIMIIFAMLFNDSAKPARLEPLADELATDARGV